MLKNHLQKISYPLAILGTFLCVPHISAEEVSSSLTEASLSLAEVSPFAGEEFNPLPNPYTVDEVCSLWTMDKWIDAPLSDVEFEQELLSRPDYLSLLKNDLAMSEHEISLIPSKCKEFAVRETLYETMLRMEEHRKIIVKEVAERLESE